VTVYWATLFAAIAVSTVGQFLLKSGAIGEGGFLDQVLRWQTILGFAFYGTAALLYIVALRRIPVSVALPATAVSYVVATAVGHYVFGEPVSLQHIGALALICSGVVILALA